MITIRKIARYIFDSDYRWLLNSVKGKYDAMEDSEYLKRIFKIKVHYDLNLENPHTYNEKLQWLKLYYHNPQYTLLADKYSVKKYVSDLIGEEYIIPTIGVWYSVDDIDYANLPDQFVLKCTHDSGGIVICKDKSKFNFTKAKNKLRGCMNRNFYYQGREWPYKNIVPRIIAEQYMEDIETSELRDYKFFCFDGKVKALFIATDRQNKSVDTKFDFFDKNFNHLPFINGHPNASNQPKPPINLVLMESLAEKLSSGMPHVRIDLYEINGKVYFGEYTFFHHSGLETFIPKEWDDIFGSYLNLPEKML